MLVKTLPARDFIKNYGSVADSVTAGEPVRVTKHGRTAYYMVPPSANIEEILREMARERLTKIMSEAKSTPAATALSDDELSALINANENASA